MLSEDFNYLSVLLVDNIDMSETVTILQRYVPNVIDIFQLDFG